MAGVMETLMSSLRAEGNDAERVKEAEAGCKCAESWIDYGLGAEYVIQCRFYEDTAYISLAS
jgi:hypothetical protein